MSCDEACSRAEERIVNDVTAYGVVENRTPHKLHRLLRAGPCGVFLGTTERIQIGDLPKRGLRTIPAPVGGLTLAYGIPARFVFPVIVASAQRKVLLCPNNLGPDAKPGRL